MEPQTRVTIGFAPHMLLPLVLRFAVIVVTIGIDDAASILGEATSLEGATQKQCLFLGVLFKW